MPFDSKDPLGYLLVILIQYIFILNATQCSICPATYPIATSFMLVSLTDDLKEDVHHINEINKLQANRLQIIKTHSEFIRFHAEIKE